MSTEPASTSASPGLLRVDELRALLDAANDAVVAMDADGRIVEWNDAATHLLGWTRGEAVGRAMASLLVPERHLPAHAAGLERHLRTGERRLIGRRVELSACRHDGSEVPVELSLSTATLAGRRSFFAVMHDLRGDRTLELERERADVLVAVTSDAVLACSADGTIRSWNDAAARTFGREAGDVLGHPLGLLGLDDLAERVGTTAQGSTRPVERVATGVHADGRLLDLTVVVVPLAAASEPTDVLLVVHDRTRLARAEADLAEARERFDGAFEHAPLGMLVADAEGRAIAVNDALCRLLDRRADELLELPVARLAVPEHADAVAAAAGRLAGSPDDAIRLEVALGAADDGELAARLTASAACDAETGHLHHVVWQVEPLAPPAPRSAGDAG